MQAVVDLKLLRKLAETGKTVKEIALEMNLKASRIRYYLTTRKITGPLIQPRYHVSPHLRAEVAKLWQNGSTVRDIAKVISHPEGTINSILSVDNLWGAGRYTSEHTDTEPPSLAMLRLAQFDPVIARALRARLGQKEEGDESPS